MSYKQVFRLGEHEEKPSKLHSGYKPRAKWFWQYARSGRIQRWDEFVAGSQQNEPDEWWHCRALVQDDGEVISEIDCMNLKYDPIYTEPGRMNDRILTKEPLRRN